jgi:hypothetical protein
VIQQIRTCPLVPAAAQVRPETLCVGVATHEAPHPFGHKETPHSQEGRSRRGPYPRVGGLGAREGTKNLVVWEAARSHPRLTHAPVPRRPTQTRRARLRLIRDVTALLLSNRWARSSWAPLLVSHRRDLSSVVLHAASTNVGRWSSTLFARAPRGRGRRRIAGALKRTSSRPKRPSSGQDGKEVKTKVETLE